jgi:cytochrome c oxidase subunit IV
MGYAGSIFVIAVGAILRYATNIHVEGVSMDTVGLILMIAGAAALILSLFMDLVWSDRMRRREAVVDERLPPREVPPREVPPRY